MISNTTIAIFVMLLGIFLSINGDHPLLRKIFLGIVAVVLIGNSAMRDYEYEMETNDTNRYYNRFEKTQQADWSELLNFSLTTTNYADRDPGYHIFVKCFQVFSTNFRLYLLFVAALYIIPLMRILYRNVKSLYGLVCSLVLFIMLFYGFINSGIRQVIVMGICFIAMRFVEQRRLIPFLAVICIASLIHTSAFIFIPFYFIPYLKPEVVFARVCLCAMPILFIISTTVLSSLLADTYVIDYIVGTEDNTGTPVFSALLCLVGVVSYILINRVQQLEEYQRWILCSVYVSVLLIPLTWVNSAFIRILYYYMIFLVPFIPMLVRAVTSSKRDQTALYIVLSIFLILI